jgi:uncharacterized OsmC-like protein
MPPLREIQRPLKDTYKTTPQSASITLSAHSTLSTSNPNFTCALPSTTSNPRIAGLHALAGGPKDADGIQAPEQLCSGNLLLESLAACFAVTLTAVADAMGLTLKDGTVTCTGDLDFRGTLGVRDPDGKHVPVGLTNITTHVRLDIGEEGDEARGKVEKLVSVSERYCVVLQTLKAGAGVEVRVGHVGKAMPDTRGDGEAQENGDVGGKGEGMEEGVGDEEVLRLN